MLKDVQRHLANHPKGKDELGLLLYELETRRIPMMNNSTYISYYLKRLWPNNSEVVVPHTIMVSNVDECDECVEWFRSILRLTQLVLADERFPLTLLHILTLATGRHVTGTGCEQCFNMVHIKGIEKIGMNDGLDDASPNRRNLFFDWLDGLQFELTNKYLTPLTYLQREMLRHVTVTGL